MPTVQPSEPQKLEFLVARDPAISVERILNVLAMATLNVDGITEIHTHLDEWARKNAGSNSVFLVDLYGAGQRAVELPLNVAMAEGNFQPKIVMRIEPVGKIQIDGTDYTLPGTVAAAQERHKKAKLLNQDRLREYVRSCHYMFSKFEPSWPQVRRINCYTFTMRNGSSLPSIGYMLQRAKRRIDPAYFEQNLNIVLAREGVSRAELEKMPITDRRVLNIMAQTLMVWSNSALYVSDEAYLRREPSVVDEISCHFAFAQKQTTRDNGLQLIDLEEMELAEYYGGDDCEGLALKIIRDGDALLHLEDSQLSKALLVLKAARRQYVFFLALCGVTTGDIGGDFSALCNSSQPLGAHMFCLAVPYNRVFELMRRCNDAAPLFQDPPAHHTTASSQLPVMFLEGTGLLHPLPVDLPETPRLALPRVKNCTPSEVIRKIVAGIAQHIEVSVEETGTKFLWCDQNNGCAHFPGVGTTNPAITNNSLWMTLAMQQCNPDAFKGVRKWYWWRERGASHFYRTLQVLFTHDFIKDGYGVSTFSCMRHAKKRTLGFTIPDLFDAAPVAGLWAEPPLTAQELHAINAEMLNAPPQPPLIPAPPAPGVNNMDWDKTAKILTVDENAEIAQAKAEFQYAAAHTALVALVELFKNADEISGALLGRPILCPPGNACPCGAALVYEKVLTEKPDLCQAFRDVLKLPADATAQQTTQALVLFYNEKLTKKRQDYQLPICFTFLINRQQMLHKNRRAAILHQLNSCTKFVSDNGVVVLAIPLSLHWLSEQITADVGSYMIQCSMALLY